MTIARTRPQREHVREALIDAAAEEFLGHGYEGTTMSRIAARAGFTKGAAYSNFEGKAGLLAAACLRRFQATTQLVSSAMAEGGAEASDVAERLTTVVIDSSRWAQLLTEVAAVARHDSETARVYLHIRDAQLEGIVAELRALDLPLRSGVETSADLLQALMAQIGFERAVVPERWPDERIAATISAMVAGVMA